ncbi:MAG TPA: thiamine pyrophosphate-binding protein [Candidatus Dormibacteraeota bacterium]|nr:thiamine pyrophosphate-binding protein [Candidatus Dormibacteraeota bacterium]
MSVASHTTPHVSQMTGAQAVVESLIRHGITAGFGIPSIHNIAVYEALRQRPEFQHWVVRHEQAAGYAADGFYRRSGQIAAILASTGPGNLFTLVPLLESLQNNIPVLLIGTNIASSLLTKSGGALHETPDQLEIIRPLTRFARRVTSPDALIDTIAEAVAVLRGSLPGPAFIEIPHDFFLAPVNADLSKPTAESSSLHQAMPVTEIEDARRQIATSRTPAILVGAGVRAEGAAVRQFAELLQCPVFTTTSGKSMFAGDHPLSLGCISRLGSVQEVFQQSDLLISFGARLTEFDTGRFGLQLPPQHIQVVEDVRYAGDRIPSTRITGEIAAIAQAFAQGAAARLQWCDIAAIKATEERRLEALGQDSYAALKLIRAAMNRNDVLVNDQSILNYWASAFFPVLERGTFLYPSGSGTLGYALPAAIGAACAVKRSGDAGKIVCIAGDGGFQYTQHELATLAQYDLPVKILLVNDDSYGVIAFLQRSMFGQTHEVALKNPDFCRVAQAYGIRAERITSIAALEQRMPEWLNAPGPALLEWRIQLKAPWEVGAIPRPTGIAQQSS